MGTGIRYRRASPRVSHRDCPGIVGLVRYVAGAIEGVGMMIDASASGAAVELATKRLEVGTEVEFFLLQSETAPELRAVAEVTRQTRTGFAVRFRRIEREFARMVLRAVEEAQSGGS